jgi:hypothetical protein
MLKTVDVKADAKQSSLQEEMDIDLPVKPVEGALTL